jgi:hypothetical protein
VSDLNLFWDISGKPLIANSLSFQGKNGKQTDLAGWQAQGHDRHSLVADPKFRNLPKFDFALAPDSPAFALGFEPIDLSDVGPRPLDKRSD